MLCDINSERCQGSLGEACDVWLTGSLIGWLERENGNLPVNMDFCFIWYQMRSTSVYRGYRSWWQGHWKWDKELSLSHIHMHNDTQQNKPVCLHSLEPWKTVLGQYAFMFHVFIFQSLRAMTIDCCLHVTIIYLVFLSHVFDLYSHIY